MAEMTRLDFLGRVSLLGLRNHVVFRPESVSDYELRDFCLPARVIEEKQWQRLVLQNNNATHSSNLPFELWQQVTSGPKGVFELRDSDYVLPTHEVFLRHDYHGWTIPRRLNQAMEAGARHCILRGEPGEGKTTALWLQVVNACAEMANRLSSCGESIDATELLVPLAFPLATTPLPEQNTDLTELALNYMLGLCYGSPSNAPPRALKWINAKIKAKQFELYLDALDELVTRDDKEFANRSGGRHVLSRRDWLSRQLTRYGNVPVLMTTRLSADDHGLLHDPQRYRMVCFGPRQVSQYIERYFSHVDGGVKFAAEIRQRLRLSPGPRHLVQIPLLLAILCDRKARHPGEPLPTTRTELLRNGLHSLLEHGDRRRGHHRHRRSRNRDKEALLRLVAFEFYRDEPLPIATDGLLEIFNIKMGRFKSLSGIDADTLLAEYLEDGILVPTGSDTFQFILRSFHEYCLAGFIASELDPGRVRAQFLVDVAPERWGSPREKPLELGWRQIWPLVAGQSADLADWLLEKLSPEDSSYYSSRSPEDCERFKIVASIIRESKSATARSLKVRDRFIEEIKGPFEYDYEFNDWVTIRFFALAEALALIGDEAARDTLIGLLNRAVGSGESACLRALGTIGDGVSREALIARLNVPNVYLFLRMECASALSAIGDKRSRDFLLVSLNDHDAPTDVRVSSAHGLGLIGDRTSRDVLIQLLNELRTPHEIRKECASALGGIGDERSHEALKVCLVDPATPDDLKMHCADMIRKITGPAAFES